MKRRGYSDRPRRGDSSASRRGSGSSRTPSEGAARRLSSVEAEALTRVLAESLEPGENGRALQLFQSYVALILAWNARGNLISRGDESRIVRRHVVESLACLPFVDRFSVTKGTPTSLLDLGSGAGFPGIPLKIVRPGLSIVLLESRRMRTLFLRKAISDLRLQGIEVWNARAEQLADIAARSAQGGEPRTTVGDPSRLGPEDLGSPEALGRLRFPAFDIVAVRAVADLRKLAAWTETLVHPGGLLIAFKGSRVDEELEGWKHSPGPWSLFGIERGIGPNVSLVILRRESE